MHCYSSTVEIHDGIASMKRFNDLYNSIFDFIGGICVWVYVWVYVCVYSCVGEAAKFQIYQFSKLLLEITSHHPSRPPTKTFNI